MKLSTLLYRRQMLLQQARLANVAFAYARMSDFAARIARAQLRGTVTFKHAAPAAERYCATLTALEASQSVVEEHFTDNDLMELGDVIAFMAGMTAGDGDGLEITFALEAIPELFLAPLRTELEQAGVAIDGAVTTTNRVSSD